MKVDPEHPDREAVAAAVRALEAGGVVSFPTETVYGLCADAGNRAAIERLYALKGRDPARACAYLIGDAAEAGPLPPSAARIAERLWPGPVTVVVDGSGYRLPALPLARALADAFGRPLVQTSANRSGERPARDAAGVRRAFGDAVDLVLDGGPAAGGPASTVVRCEGRRFEILREGAVDRETLERAVTDVLLFVCTGNLCRSPTAEAMVRKELAAAIGCAEDALPEHGFSLGSFGTMARDGAPAPPEAIEVGDEHGIDLRAHRSRPFTIALVKSATRIYCMDRGHRDFLSPYGDADADLLLMMDPKGRDIPDPYGRSRRVYRKAASLIAAATTRRVQELLGETDGDPPATDDGEA